MSVPYYTDYAECSIKRIAAKMVKAKKFVLRKYFDGFPKPDDLELVEEELPPLKDGGNTHFLGYKCFIVYILFYILLCFRIFS